VSARLIYHGYVVIMGNLYVLFILGQLNPKLFSDLILRKQARQSFAANEGTASLKREDFLIAI
jgi:hypothetical protein